MKKQEIIIPNGPEAVALAIAEKKQHDLHAELRAKNVARATLCQQFAAALEERRPTLEIEADAVLGVTGVRSRHELEQDMATVDHEIEVLAIAIDRQNKEVARLRGQYSATVCEANRQRYVEVEKQIAKAVRELAIANQAEVDFFDSLHAAGCASISFRPMRLNVVGLASDGQSLAAFHRREVAEFCPEAAI